MADPYESAAWRRRLVAAEQHRADVDAEVARLSELLSAAEAVLSVHDPDCGCDEHEHWRSLRADA